jgi:hypothetical protein
METERDGLEVEDFLMEYDIRDQMAYFYLGEERKDWFWRVIVLFFNDPQELLTIY